VLRLVPADRPKSEGNVIPIELRQNNGEAAYALYVRASEIDERPDTYDIAETLYRRAVHLDPTLAIAWTNLGNVRYRRGDTEGAMQIWQRALQIQPNQIEAIINMGIAIDDALEDAEAAVPWYERVLSLDAKYIDAHVRLAQCLDEMGHADRARRHWRRSLELEPHGHYARAARQALGLQRVK
jgi:tetratricopeptide (TPR) repeat protein